MKWRVVLELTEPDGTVVVREVGGRDAVGEYTPRTIGLTLAEGKQMLAMSMTFPKYRTCLIKSMLVLRRWRRMARMMAKPSTMLSRASSRSRCHHSATSDGSCRWNDRKHSAIDTSQ